MDERGIFCVKTEWFLAFLISQPKGLTRLSRRHLPITIVAVILLATGVVGYMIPASEADVPKRVLLQSSGGKVIFGHETHADDYGQDCQSCHHQGTASAEAPEKTVACGSCHAKTFDQRFIDGHPTAFEDERLCASCHHMEFKGLIFDHPAHQEYAGEDCMACHHDESIDPDGPSKCSSCHTARLEGSRPSLGDASHQRCADCHYDVFEEKTAGCSYCHEEREADPADAGSVSCSTCHEEKTADLIPERTAAFHGQCMGCHEEFGAGPYGDDSCNRCHMK